MNAYIEPLSQKIWNFEFDDANLDLDLPRVATLRGMKHLLRATVTDNPKDRELALKELDNAMKISKSILGKKDKIEELSLQIASLNQMVKENLEKQEKRKSVEGYGQEVQNRDLGTEFINTSLNGSINESELTYSCLYPDPTDSDGVGTGFENLSEKLQCRPEPLTDASIIAKNLELDIGATIATIHLWIAITNFLSRNFITGGLSMRRSWKKYSSLYKEIQKKDQEYEQDVIDSIEAGTGSFLYSVSVIPGGVLKSILKVIGFREDEDLGISLVWDVLFRQGSEIPMVFLVLAANYLFLASEMDIESSLSKFRPVIEYCLHRYNTGLTFKFVASVFVKKTGHIQSALSHLESGISHCEGLTSSSEGEIIPSSFYIDYSQAFMYLFEYDKAEEILNKAFMAPFDFTKKGLVALHLAVCQLQLDKTENLDFLLREMTRLAKNYKQETYTNTKAKVLALCKKKEDKDLLLNIAAFEMMYYWKEIPFMKPNLREKAIKRFEEKIGDFKNITIPDLKAAAMVIYGQLISEKDSNHKQYFLDVINMKKQVKFEKQWIAFAHFELANIEAENENYDLCLLQLKQLFSIKSFPFDDVLQTRAKSLEKAIRGKQIESRKS